MPATRVSPALRRRISDDARELLRSALESSDLEPLLPENNRAPHLLQLPLEERLQNFRSRLRLELLVGANEDSQPVTSFELRLAVATSAYLVRFPLERAEAEASVANQSGVMTSWITSSDGHHQQLQSYLDSPHSDAASKPQIRSLLAMADMLDLLDLFAACSGATRVRASATGRQDIFFATSDKNSYVFAFSGMSGQPESITIAPLASTDSSPALRLCIDQYVRLSTGIDVPAGIQSDVQLMIDTALRCVSQWSREGQEQLANVFAALDTDEELSLREFAGVWVSLLADGHAVSDPHNEPGVLAALDRLFFGE